MRAEGELIALVPPKVRIVNLGARRFRNAAGPLARYLRAASPDAVLVSLWPMTVVAILARLIARSKSRLVVSDHSILSVQYGGSPTTMGLLKATTRLLYPAADARVCVSASTADDLARLSGLPRDRLVVIRNPTATSPRVANDSMIEALWNGAEKRILTVGSLKPAKEHGLLLRAFARLDRSIGARLMILGEGPLRAELQGLAAALGIADRVVMPGFAVDPWPHYRSADLFVLSSSREGYPTVLLEALAAGLPVVTTDCGSGPREIVGQGKFGTLVPPDDADALAAAIEAALRRSHDPKPGQAWVRQLGEGSVDAYEALLVAADS